LTSLPPAEGVNETELSVTAKERSDVPGGGVKGTAAKVRISVALPLPPPQFTVQGFFTPLQEMRGKIAADAMKTRTRLVSGSILDSLNLPYI
jgi:hypothetical protein